LNLRRLAEFFIPDDVHGLSGGLPMALLDYSGYAAALCTTGAYIPQVIRVWRTRSTQDISLKMFLVLVTGLMLWLVYGFWRGEIPLIAANGVTLMLASIILYFKIRHG
jgi:MtN3 and saliva related transmembrane protein